MTKHDIMDQEGDEWLIGQFDAIVTNLDIMLPSEWAEKQRYLPPAVTPIPGYYRFAVAPYLREIVDCGSPYSPIREIDVLKGVQTCFTVGVIENIIGYNIDHISDAAMMFLTADAELAKMRIEQYVTPMIEHSDLGHLIMSSDHKNTRKTGQTDKKIEWRGGGSLIPYGAQNANKLRSISVKVLLCDEIDAYPDRVGKDGDPLALSKDRTASFEASRKIFRGSTPLITQTSKAWREFKKGDQREYHVPCKKCGELQKLVWHGVNKDDGTVYGMIWKLDEANRLIPGSVRYVCKFCQAEWINEDKTWMFREDGKYCKWVPSATSVDPTRRSYHIPAFYSPVGMQTWEAQVRKFLDAYDPVLGRVVDIEAYQLFRNNVEGLPFEMRGSQLKVEKVQEHRSPFYESGTVPNDLAERETEHKVVLLLASVDVHKKHLDVLVQGFTQGGRQYSIDWFKIEGEDFNDISDPGWQELDEFIEEKVYPSDDGNTYKPVATFIDCNYATMTVYDFVNTFSHGVFAVRGKDKPAKNAHYKEFSEFETKVGSKAYHIIVDHYKDRVGNALRGSWESTRGPKPRYHMTFPRDYGDDFFTELTREERIQVVNPKTGVVEGFKWHRPGNAGNHAWDLTIYCTAGLDMLALDYCKHQLDIDYISWPDFWAHAEQGSYTIDGKFKRID